MKACSKNSRWQVCRLTTSRRHRLWILLEEGTKYKPKEREVFSIVHILESEVILNIDIGRMGLNYELLTRNVGCE